MIYQYPCILRASFIACLHCTEIIQQLENMLLLDGTVCSFVGACVCVGAIFYHMGLSETSFSSVVLYCFPTGKQKEFTADLKGILKVTPSVENVRAEPQTLGHKGKKNYSFTDLDWVFLKLPGIGII